ncbi:hypothetical protein LTR37_003401 [Vermiconidia calcicola]|uniref:Uncharacterized protein n=1 Tax=Vermiconidia calcicola TaxID=1690605 RepID=A0ACC3NQN4_9PEZI|nr:hypothetical protein LTR37_003401 [Vermiconidia calcicola]
MDGDSMDVDGSSYLEKTPIAHTFPPQQHVRPAAARSSQPLLGLTNLGREAAKPHNKRSFENMSTENEQQQKPKWVQRGDALGHSSIPSFFNRNPTPLSQKPKAPSPKRALLSSDAQHPKHQPPPPQAEIRDGPTRRIGGMFISVYVAVFGFFGAVYGYFAGPPTQQQQQEITAVETDSTGKKRRAIEASSSSSPQDTPSQTPFLKQSTALPGTYEEDTTMSEPAETETAEPDHQLHTPSTSSPGEATSSPKDDALSKTHSQSTAVPGTYEDNIMSETAEVEPAQPQQLNTPPDSRPGSSQGQTKQDPQEIKYVTRPDGTQLQKIGNKIQVDPSIPIDLDEVFHFKPRTWRYDVKTISQINREEEQKRQEREAAAAELSAKIDAENASRAAAATESRPSSKGSGSQSSLRRSSKTLVQQLDELEAKKRASATAKRERYRLSAPKAKSLSSPKAISSLAQLPTRRGKGLPDKSNRTYLVHKNKQYGDEEPPRAIGDTVQTNDERDAEVEALVNRTRKAVIDPPEQQALRQSWNERNAAAEEAKKQQAEEAARQKAEKDAEEARAKEHEEWLAAEARAWDATRLPPDTPVSHLTKEQLDAIMKEGDKFPLPDEWLSDFDADEAEMRKNVVDEEKAAEARAWDARQLPPDTPVSHLTKEQLDAIMKEGDKLPIPDEWLSDSDADEAEEMRKKLEEEKAEEARKQAEMDAEIARVLAEGNDVSIPELDDAELSMLDNDWPSKQSIIRPLPADWDEKINEAMASKNKDHTICKTVEGTELRKHDFNTLIPTRAWLNDEIVNAWMATIVQSKLEKTGYKRGNGRVPAFAAYTSMWHSNVKAKGVKSIETWSRRKQIKGEALLKCEKIFFPINTGNHWMLLIISPQAREIEVLDSLNQGGVRQHYGDVAKAWLQMELGDKFVEAEWTLLESKSAWQQNTDDCGAFVCFNALAAAKGVAFAEVGKGKMADGRRIMGAVLINGGFHGDWKL